VNDALTVCVKVLVLLGVNCPEPVPVMEAVCVLVIVTEGLSVTAPVFVDVFVCVWVCVPVMVTLGLVVLSLVPDTEGETEGLFVMALLGVLEAVSVGLAVREAVLVRVKELV
jgi:hypothetical protein